MSSSNSSLLFPVAETELTPEQWQALLAQWNDTGADYPHAMCMHELIEDQAARTPQGVALRFEAQSLSYAELNGRANRLACYLRERGVGPDVCVGLCVERSLEMMVGLLAILKAGGAYVPLDVSYPEQRLAYMVENSRFELVLAHEAVRAKADALVLAKPALRLVLLDDPQLTQQLERFSDANLARLAGQSSRNLAYVIYTSGSTGQPKGVMVEHQAVVNRLDWMRKTYPLETSDVVLQKTPFSFDVSVWELTWPLLTGACLVLARPEGHRDVDYLTALIQASGVTNLHFVPSMMALMLAESAWSECDTVRRVFCSGEALSPDIVRQHYARHDAPMFNLYGPTEAAIEVSYWACPRDPNLSRVLIGRPIQNIQLYVLDKDRALLPPGRVGELYIAGVCLARGYLNRDDLTAERFVANPFAAQPGAKMYRTGDLARYCDDGNIEYLGRIDNQVKINGLRIELGEIESQLRRHEAVLAAVVLAREDIPGDKQLVAYVVAVGSPTVAALRKHLQTSLPGYMVPTLFVFVDVLPLSPSGKVDAKALPMPEPTRRRLRAAA